MAKQLNINMNINANTSKAQTELKKLQSLLDEAIMGTVKDSGKMKISQEISEATQAAIKLKGALSSAINQNTGTLDLSKFSEQLSKSNMSLKQYSNQLLNLGPTGEKAFLQMAKSIAIAETPLRKSNGLLSELWTTMKNTARWQLSSSALHSFMGAIQGAYNYAQDLNKSLNNIKIVSGQTTEQMTKFAEQANKAAVSLSTTTTAYTDAALIYYQQGLSGDEVKERTNATIKLANVSRQSAEEVSSQMTAIWNNFAKGSSNLEYYADVITKLGASTASSSSEIAEGLSKFAAVADTVGLSYEKASAAVATVVAETRQSADTVGTAFKTMFARIQGLQLGETLEDGVTLNKYSEALNTVGVNILDSNGKLKEMDTILDELGSKWDSIGENQKVALAETVAGVRQYTQFMALMNNYNKIESNETLAEGSKGTLQKQADTYAESWEAASKRVKAAAQGIYQELLDDKFFIGLNNLLASVLEGLNKFIKSIGGLPGVLGILGTIGTKVFKEQIALSIDNAVYNLSVFTGVAKDSATKMKQELNDVINSFNKAGEVSELQGIENKVIIETNKLVSALSEKKDKLLQQDYEDLQLMTQITEQYGQQAIEAAKKAEEADKKQSDIREEIVQKRMDQDVITDQKKAEEDGKNFGIREMTKSMSGSRENSGAVLDEIEAIITKSEAGKAAIEAINTALSGEGIDTNVYEQVSKNLDLIESAAGKLNPTMEAVKTAMNDHKEAVQKVAEKEEKLKTAQQQLNSLEKSGKASAADLAKARAQVKAANTALETANNKLKKSEEAIGTASKTASQHLKNQATAEDSAMAHARQADMTKKQEIQSIRDFIQAIREAIQSENEAITAEENYENAVKTTKDAVEQATSEMKTSFGQGLTNTFQGISQISMGLSSLKGMFEALNDTDMSFGEKFLSVATSLGIAIPSLISGLGSLKTGFGDVKDGVLAGIKALALHAGLMTKEEVATKGLSIAKMAEAINEKIRTGAIEAGYIAEEKGIATSLGSKAAAIATAIAKGGETSSRWANVAAIIAEETAMSPLLVITLLLVAAMAALAAIVFVVVATVNAITDAYNADANAAKDAEEAATNLAEAYNKCKEEYQSLVDAFSQHNEALNTIESLTKGTREWRDAIREANEKALELIDSEGLMKDKDYTIDANGIIRFNEGVEEQVLDNKADEVANAQAASIMANQRAKVARAKSDLTDLTRSEHKSQWYDSAIMSSVHAVEDAQSDVKIRGAVARLTTGDLAQDFKDNKISSDDLAKKLDIDDEDLLKSITELSKTINKNTEAEEQSYQLAAESIIAEDENVQSSRFKDELTNASGRIYKQFESKANEKAKEDLKDSSKAESKMKKYAELAGLTKLEGYKAKDYNSGEGSLTYEYTDNGETKEKTVKIDEIASVLSNNDASKSLSTSLVHLDDVISNLKNDIDEKTKETKAENEAAIDFISNGDFSQSTKAEVDALQKNATDSKSYLDQAFGDGKNGLSDEEAKQYGYETADAMVKAFEEKQGDIQKEWKKITINKDDYGLKHAEELSLESAKAIQSNFDKIKLGANGKKDAKEYINGINDMLDTVDPSKQKEALEALSGIDWSSDNALEQADETLQKFNGDIDVGSKKWQNYAKQMKIASGASPDFKTMRADIANVVNILSKLDFGKTISEEDYNTLTKNHASWKEYFQMQADGTRKFIGNVEELKEANRSSIQEMEKNVKKRKDIQKDVNKVSYKNDDGKNIDFSKLNFGEKSKDAAISAGKELSEHFNDKDKATQKMLKLWGFDKATLDQAIADAEANDKDAQKRLKRLYKNIAEFKSKNFDDEEDSTKEMYASTATTFEELDGFANNKKLNLPENAIKKQAEVIKTESLSAAKSIDELDAAVSKIEQYGSKFDVGVNSNEVGKALMTIASEYANTTKEVEEYNKALKNSSEGTAESKRALEEATDSLRAATVAGEAANKYGLDAEVIEAQAKAIKKVNGDIKLTAEESTKLAIANQRMNKGVKSLHDNFKEWKKTLRTADKTSMDYAQTTSDVTKAMRNLLNTSDKWELPEGFLESPKNLKLLGQAAKGDEKAINQLGVSCAQAEIKTKKFNKALADAFNNDKDRELKFTINEESFKEAQKTVNKGIEDIQNNLSSLVNGTMTLDEAMGGSSASWIASLNEMAIATGMSVDEMNNTLNQMGVTAKVDVINVKQPMEVPTYDEYSQVEKTDEGEKDKDGNWITPPTYHKKTWTVPGKPVKVEGYQQIAQISTDDNPKTPDINFTGVGGTANRGSTNRGGGVSKSSTKNDNGSGDNNKTSAASHEHNVNRYSNEENAIKGLSDQYARLNKIKDQAFGMSRVQAIENEIKKLKELKKASASYIETIAGKGNASKVAKTIYNGGSIGQLIASGQLGGTIGSDFKSLSGGLSASGKGLEYTAKDSFGNERLVSDSYSLSGFNSTFGTNVKFSLDSYGNLQNKDSILNLIQNLKNKENSAYSSKANPTGADTTAHNKRLAYLEEIKERIDQYNSTAALLGEKTQEYLDYIATLQQKNAEKITVKMETGVELGKKTSQRIERALKVLGDTIYKSTEAMQQWYNKTFKDDVKAKKAQARAYDKAFDETEEKYKKYVKKNGEFNSKAIDPDSAAKLLSSIEEGYNTLIDDFLSKLEEGKGHYAKTIEIWKNKIADVTSQIELNVQTLDHYQKVLQLAGKSGDYKSMGIILKGQISNTQDSYDVNQRLYKDAEARYKKAEEGYKKRQEQVKNGELSKEALEDYYEHYVVVARQERDNALKAFQSSTTDLLEAINAWYQNEVNRMFHEAEQQLAGEWGTFDLLNKSMERQKSIADEYLTKTNQLYETNTLLRKIQTDVDKTDSRLAKDKLNSFANEIKAMKNKNDLTKVELEIAKARYEVLKAQIALEEAQNAKSTVRLQRDDEGNYGYVYTADQDKVSEAEQNLADKQNNLYNLVLGYTQDYAEKIKKLEEEHMAALEEIANNSLLTEVEKNEAMETINAEYYAKREVLLRNHNEAIKWLDQTAATDRSEAWTESYEKTISDQNAYKQKTSTLCSDLKSLMNDVNQKRTTIVQQAGLDNETLATTVGDVTQKTKDLKTEITKKGGLADGMKTAAKKARKLTEKFYNQYDALKNLITKYQNAADEVNKLYQKVLLLTKAQKDYNQSLREQPNANYGSGNSGGYGDNNNGSTNKPKAVNNTNNKNNKKNDKFITHYRVSDNKTGAYFIVTGDEVSFYQNQVKNGKLVYSISKLKTGGYTGSWTSGKTGLYTGSWDGPDLEDNGKLAFLHQKELVLNADDTENMLQTVKFVRQLNELIDLQALAKSQNLYATANNLATNGLQTIEQEVTIHAEFPNVQNHNEIEEAFHNLINRASQFANRDSERIQY